jgi:glycerol transport system ATP-binding protein
VRRIDDIGRTRIARIELAGHPMAATIPEDVQVDGASAALRLDPAQIHIYADGRLVEGRA